MSDSLWSLALGMVLGYIVVPKLVPDWVAAFSAKLSAVVDGLSGANARGAWYAIFVAALAMFLVGPARTQALALTALDKLPPGYLDYGSYGVIAIIALLFGHSVGKSSASGASAPTPAAVEPTMAAGPKAPVTLTAAAPTAPPSNGN